MTQYVDELAPSGHRRLVVLRGLEGSGRAMHAEQLLPHAIDCGCSLHYLTHALPEEMDGHTDAGAHADVVKWFKGTVIAKIDDQLGLIINV